MMGSPPGMRGLRAKIKGWAEGWNVLIATLLGLAAAVALIALQLSDNSGEPDSTTLGLFVAAILFLFAALAPAPTAKTLSRITTLKLAGIEVSLAQGLSLAERVRPVPERDDRLDLPARRHGEGYPRILDLLQGRLRMMRIVLGLDHDLLKHDYHGIAGRLRELHLLDHDEETFVHEFLEGTPADFGDWPDSVRSSYLDLAYAFAVKLGADTWDRHVRNELGRKLLVLDFEQKRGHRPDFLVWFRERGSTAARWALVTARLGEPGADYFELTGKRLSGLRATDVPALPKRRWIVVPAERLENVIDPSYRDRDDADHLARVISLEEVLARPAVLLDGMEFGAPLD